MKGYISARILAALQDGPGMAYDIATAMDMDADRASTKLAALSASGKVCRRKFHLSGEAAATRGRNEVWIYSLPEHAGWAG